MAYYPALVNFDCFHFNVITYKRLKLNKQCLSVKLHGHLIITSEREARSEFLLIYTKNLSMSGRPARRPAGPPAVVTLLGGLYLWKRKPD